MMPRFVILNHSVLATFTLILAICASGSSHSYAQGMHGRGGMGGGDGMDGTTTTNTIFADHHYSGSGNCVQCHDGLTDSAGNDVSIVQAWKASTMANATRDPYWRAKVATELRRTQDRAEEINFACSRCHAPMANDAATKDGVAVEIFGSGFLDPANPYFEHAGDGVSCTLCHQIADDGTLGTPVGSSGAFHVNSYTDVVDRPAFGQYLDIFADPMRNRASFTPQYGAHTSTSAMCATCHDLKTPTFDPQGNPATPTFESRFPEQMVFTEWGNSAYRNGGEQAKSCQGCHMPKIDGVAKISNRPLWLAPRSGFALHELLGGNTQILGILAYNVIELQTPATAADFNAKIERTRHFLKGAATVEIVSATKTNGVLEAKIRITNKSGHKLPSGYPSRRAWLHVTVTDNRGRVLFESGKLNADGSIVGADSDANLATFEPHHQVITEPGQVQIYEPVAGDLAGNVTRTLLHSASYLKDNRLVPIGFNKLTVPSDVRVMGNASSDPDFDSGSDTVTYRIEVGKARSVTVTAELNYQALSFNHLVDLFEDSDIPEVAAFKRMVENQPIRAETIASTTRSLR